MDLEEAQDRADALIKYCEKDSKPMSMHNQLVEEVEELGRAIKMKNENKTKEGLSTVLFIILAISRMVMVDLGTELENKIERDWEKHRMVNKN